MHNTFQKVHHSEMVHIAPFERVPPSDTDILKYRGWRCVSRSRMSWFL